MPDSKFFSIPFATSGDRAAIPDAAQSSGGVSFTQGFGPDYERNPATDPLAKRVPRDETNEYLFQLTNSVKFLQLYGLPEWYATDTAGTVVTYPLNARVRYQDNGWISVSPNNTATPGTDSTKWVLATPRGAGDADIPVLGWQATPPASPAFRDRYVVNLSPTGAWAGQATKIAEWTGASWAFYTPTVGLQVNYNDNGTFAAVWWDGTVWTALPRNQGLWRVVSSPAVASRTLLRTDIGTIFYNRSDGGNITFILPNPQVFGQGHLGFLRAGAGNLTVSCNGGTIQMPGNPVLASITLNTVKAWLYLFCDGSNWIVMSADPVLNQRLNQSLGTAGYRIDPGESIEQWGSSVVTVSNGLGTISFPIAFPSICWTIVAVLGDSQITQSDISIVGGWGTTQFVFRAPDAAGNVRINWMAKGR